MAAFTQHLRHVEEARKIMLKGRNLGGHRQVRTELQDGVQKWVSAISFWYWVTN